MEQKISALLQKAVISLCKQNYLDKIEVDGIICISSLHNSVEKHVVKIHQKLDPGKMTVEENLAMTFNQNSHATPAYSNFGRGDTSMNFLPSSEEIWRVKMNVDDPVPGNGMVGDKAAVSQLRQKVRKRTKKSFVSKTDEEYDDKSTDPDFTCNISNSTADNFPAIVNELKTGRSLRKRNQNAPMNTYADNSVVESDESGSFSNTSDLGGLRSDTDRYGLSDSSFGLGSSKGLGSASVLLKLLAKPQRNKEQEEKIRLVKKEPQIEIVNDELPTPDIRPLESYHLESEEHIGVRDGLENIPENANNAEIQLRKTSSNAVVTSEIFSHEKLKSESQMVEDKENGGTIVIKKEPSWNEDEYGASSSQINYKISSMSNSEINSGRSEDGEQYMGSDSIHSTDSRGYEEDTEKSQNQSADQSVDESKYYKMNSKDPTDASNKRSILMNILKGKSLKEAYIGEDGEPNNDEQSTVSEQENSLLYRLPFVSFQDLFPGNSSTMLQNEISEKQSKASTKPRPTLQTIDYMASQMLQRQIPSPSSNTGQSKFGNTQRKGRSDNAYSTRLSSGRKKQVSYVEMADFILSSEDEDDEGVMRDPYDSPYTPEYSEYMRQEQDNVATGAKRRKMGPKCKQTDRQKEKKTANSRGSNYEDQTISLTGMAGNWLGGFPCGICGRVFENKVSRDRHEDEERENQFYKCPLCGGFFGNEAAKLAHMKERHGIEDVVQDKAKTESDLNLVPLKVSVYNNDNDCDSDTVRKCDSINNESDIGNTSSSINVKSECELSSYFKCSLCDMSFEDNTLKKVHLKSFHGFEENALI